MSLDSVVINGTEVSPMIKPINTWLNKDLRVLECKHTFPHIQLMMITQVKSKGNIFTNSRVW